MLARIRKAQENDEGGFTLIELLVVMIIIGILAAIAIPAFLSQKNKAKATSAKADVSTIGKEVTAYYVDGTADLTVATDAPGGTWSLTGSDPVLSGKLSPGNTASGSATTGTFCVTVGNADAGADGTWSYGPTGLVKGADCTP